MAAECTAQLYELQTLLSDHNGVDKTDDLIESLHALGELYADAEKQGHSDGLILLADQLSFLETGLTDANKELVGRIIQWYITPSDQGQLIVDTLCADSWPEPLIAEEAGALSELLLVETDDSGEEINSVSAKTLPQQEPNNPLIESIIHGLEEKREDGDIEWLEEPIEQLSEQGLHGISDVLALYSAQIGDIEEEHQEPTGLALLFAGAIINFLSTPNESTLEVLVSSLCAEYDQEDVDFILPMLKQDLTALMYLEQPVVREQENTASSETEVVDELAHPITEIDAKPSFVTVDLELLSHVQPAVDLDVVAMLSESVQAQVSQWDQFVNWPDDEAIKTTAIHLASTARALETVGLTGARFIVEGLLRNIDWVALVEDKIQQAELAPVIHCMKCLVSYLYAVAEKPEREALIDSCCELQYGASLEQAAFLKGLLALASLKDASEIVRKTAEIDDVSLSRGKDIDAELLLMLKNELPQLSDEFSSNLQRIIEDQELSGLLEAQRSAHTIKGLANMAGIRGIANLTHYLEDILEVMTDSELLPSKLLGEDMLDAADCLAEMCERVAVDEEQSPGNAIESLQKVFDWHYEAKTQGAGILADENSTVRKSNDKGSVKSDKGVVNKGAEKQAKTIESAGQTTTQEAEITPQQAENNSTETVEEDAQLSISVSLLNGLFRLAGESTTLNTQLEEELLSLRRLSRQSRERYRSLERVMADLEQHLQSFSAQQTQLDTVDGNFDALEMDRYNELDSSLSRLHEAAADVSEVTGSMNEHVQQLQELQSQQSGLQKETLDTIIRTRMVPVSTIAGRVQRIVRQAARSTDKKVKLTLVGEQVQVDSQILSQLVAPLMHMIRNSVDHGIESPHARFEVGKPETGEITLSFSRDNDRFLIQCTDDGAGINGEEIRQQAVNKGLIEDDVEMHESEAQRLILLPGFSTRDEVSQLSGRGIGMDVVNLEIAKLHGSLQINSTVGQGTTLELSLPPSALTVRSLLIRSGQQVIALSTQGVEQNVISIDGRYSQDRTRFTYEDEEYQVKSIEELMGKPPLDYSSVQIHPILLIRMADIGNIALQVKEILAHRELIFKEMGDLIPMIPGISGLTILANGEVAPVVDISARVRFVNSGLQVMAEQSEVNDFSGLPTVMVVDDSISARQAIVHLLQDLGYQVSSAIDGLDAMNKIRDKAPDLILTDYEMPRVNGVELASALKSREETSRIPIAMITSRSTAKHREAAEEAGVDRYITKPWTETQLLQAIEELLEK